MSRSIRALGGGLRAVLTAPALLAGITAATLLSALPFGLVLGAELRTALANRQPVYLGTAEIDAEWWLEFRAHADGLAATFTPAIIGFAAPLDNLSAVLDGTPRPLALLIPVIVAGLLWAWLWGGVLERFHAGRGLGGRAFWNAGWRHAPTFAAISVFAAATHLVLYLTVHAALFGPLYEWLSAAVITERAAFLWRVVLYAVFGACLITVSLLADFARISRVVLPSHGVRPALEASLAFLRTHVFQVTTLVVLTGMLFVALLVMYGTAEVYGGTRLGGWRSVLIGQGYIVARLGIRLTFAAAALRLYAESTATPRAVNG
jgi:hypothetical protein